MVLVVNSEIGHRQSLYLSLAFTVAPDGQDPLLAQRHKETLAWVSAIPAAAARTPHHFSFTPL